MLKRIEKIINNSPFYNFLRFSSISDRLVEFLQEKTKKNINFYTSFLEGEGRNRLVFDIGANKGNKVKAFLKMGYRVVAIEPEKKSLETLRYRFGDNEQVEIVQKGISSSKGTLELHITDARSGLNTFSRKWMQSLGDEEENRWQRSDSFMDSYEVPVTTLEELMKEYGVPYYIKIDVEGFEWNVIKGMKRPPAFLSFESNLPEFIDESNRIINHLSGLDANCSYQYSTEEKLESAHWLSADDILKLINSGGHRYLEIICRFDG